MMRAWPRIGMIACALVLGACQTMGGRAAYEDPLRRAGVLEKDETSEERVSAETREPRNELVQVSETGIEYDNESYRVSDLAPGHRPSSESLEAGIWLTMDRMESDLRTSGNRVQDPELNAYLQNVTCRVAASYCDDIRVYAMRIPAFNASMAPNGMMQVWTGLLLRVRNEAQLAAVLGHEAGHYLRRHSMQRAKSTIETSNVLIFVNIALAGAGGGAFGNLASILAAGGLQAYGRDQEREADGYGLLLMHQSGYDPREAAKVWENLIREHDASPSDDLRDPFLASHPASAERNDVLEELGASLAAKSDRLETGRDRFLEVILPRRAAWLRDEMNLRNFETSEALLDLMLKDDPNPAELLYFKGELRRLRNEGDDPRDALDWYDRATAAAGAPPAELYRSRGLVQRRLGDPAGAARSFQVYLDANPEASDKLIIEDMIRRLTTT